MSILKRFGQRVERGVRCLVRGLPGEAWEHARYVSSASPVFIGGCGGSGTTLVSAVINSHPRLFCGPESRLLTSPSLNPRRIARRFGFDAAEVRRWVRESGSKAEFAERFLAGAAARQGKGRWADKTPGNVRIIPRIFEHFPRARFLHVIRDGRDAACSLREHPGRIIVNGEMIATGRTRPISRCARRWVEYVRRGLAFRGHERYHEVRYETLIEEPEDTLRRLFDFIEEPWSADVLEFHRGRGGPGSRGTDRPLYSSALGRWRRDLSSAEREDVKMIAGELLIELEYAQDCDW